MTERSARTAAWGIFAIALAGALATLVLWPIAGEPTGGDGVFLALLLVLGLTFCGTGAVLISRVSANPVGWLMSVVGLFQIANGLTNVYAVVALRIHPGFLPLGDLSNWASAWTWMPSVGLLATFLILLFPDGRPPTPRWRWIGWLAVVGITLGLAGTMVDAWPLRSHLDAIVGGDFSPSKAAFGAILTGVAAIASVASLVVRFRRSSGDERQQMRWFTFTAVFMATGLALAFLPIAWGEFVFAAGFLAVPIATAVSILKYRLYDLDLVIKKTVVIAVVAAVLTALYLGVIALATVGTISRLLVGGLLLAVTFNPVRRAARALADRIVYGRRATSYEVLTDFSERMAETYATDDVLPRMTQVLRGATGASSATVWLLVSGELRPAASSGDAPAARSLATTGGELPARLDDFSTEVRHQGDLLGALSVSMPANDPLDPGREKLVGDLAAQAGLVLRNVRLIEELKASRQRLVAAQDEERRKLERNIHDGAQQQLVALAVKLRLAEQIAERDTTKTRELLAQLQVQAGDALEDLRDLARGIYPPLLADKGLVAALESQARKAAVPVGIVADGIDRYPQETEAAVYFCVLEALNNVAKYADASQASVSLLRADGHLIFTIADDGNGFDTETAAYGTGLQGMADRLEAIGGTLEIRSHEGTGTTLTGRVPATVDRGPIR